MPGPASDPIAQEEMQKYQNLKDLQFREDLKAVLSTGPGRRVMYNIVFAIAGAESLSYTSVNESTNFREGRRDVGLTLMGKMQDNAPEEYLLMLTEAVRDGVELTARMKRIQEEAHGRTDGPDGD